MSTVAAFALYAAYMVWRVVEDRKAAKDRQALFTQYNDIEARLQRIEDHLADHPFLSLPRPLKL